MVSKRLAQGHNTAFLGTVKSKYNCMLISYRKLFPYDTYWPEMDRKIISHFL